MSVRSGGSKQGLDSRTRTRRPPRATAAAVYKPAAEPPTTTTSPPSRRGRELLFMSATVWFAPTDAGVLMLQLEITALEMIWPFGPPLGNCATSGIGRPFRV